MYYIPPWGQDSAQDCVLHPSLGAGQCPGLCTTSLPGGRTVPRTVYIPPWGQDSAQDRVLHPSLGAGQCPEWAASCMQRLSSSTAHPLLTRKLLPFAELYSQSFWHSHAAKLYSPSFWHSQSTLAVQVFIADENIKRCIDSSLSPSMHAHTSTHTHTHMHAHTQHTHTHTHIHDHTAKAQTL